METGTGTGTGTGAGADGSRAIVTIQDVAARAGVSAMTVSRVLNNSLRVAPETRERVQQAVAELGYVPNALASGLIKGRTRTIALIVSDITNPFFTMIVRGVEDTAQRNGYTVLIGNSDESVEKEQQYINAMLSKRIDGLLIAPASNASRQILAAVQQLHIPLVLIDREVAGISADLVVGDNIEGGKILTTHLIGLGHRRIALINGRSEVATARDRQQGYEAALREHAISIEPQLLQQSSYDRESGFRATKQLLALPAEQRPTAIVAANNFLAVGAVEAIRSAGLTIPEDIKLVSFDDIELASAIYPFFTVMAQPVRSFGTIAAQFLFERIQGEGDSQPRRVVLRPQLIIRQSCGAHLHEQPEH